MSPRGEEVSDQVLRGVEEDYEGLVERAQADPAVVGLVLTGSRGRDAFVRDGSDWDVRLIVDDDRYDDARSRYATGHGATVDVFVLTLSRFPAVGDVGSPSAWDRYSYVHAKVVIDKLDGRIAQLVVDKARLPPEAARRLAADALDDYINAYYRALKNARVDATTEAHLDGAESIPPLLTAIFAMHERVRPFNRFLGWELDRFPLPGDAWARDALLPRLRAILSTGDIGLQAGLFREVETLARHRGHAEVIDSWEPDVSWLRTGSL